MPNQARRSPARLIAPLALLLVVAATVIVVMNAASDSNGDDDSAAKESDTRRTTTTETQPTRRERRPRGDTYTVRVGDTLGAISERTGVPVEQLLELNPDLDPQALVSGQKIKLRE
jgi:LysM repeat protein